MVAFAENKFTPTVGAGQPGGLGAFGVKNVAYHRYDPETEDYYVRNRYYSPALVRWIQRDPIGYAGGINLYAHIGSSPVGNWDADGTQVWFGPFPPPGWPPAPAGRYAFPNNFVAGMGTFGVSIKTLATKGSDAYRSAVEVKFHPDAALLNHGHRCCTEIKAIQFVETTYYHWYRPSSGGEWHPDKDNPFFPGATAWRAGARRYYQKLWTA